MRVQSRFSKWAVIKLVTRGRELLSNPIRDLQHLLPLYSTAMVRLEEAGNGARLGNSETTQDHCVFFFSYSIYLPKIVYPIVLHTFVSL